MSKLYNITKEIIENGETNKITIKVKIEYPNEIDYGTEYNNVNVGLVAKSKTYLNIKMYDSNDNEIQKVSHTISELKNNSIIDYVYFHLPIVNNFDGEISFIEYSDNANVSLNVDNHIDNLKITFNTNEFITPPKMVDADSDDIIIYDGANTQVVAKIKWTETNANPHSIFNKVISYNIRCEDSLLGTLFPKVVKCTGNGEYSIDYEIPGILLENRMKEIYDTTNKETDSLLFSITSVKSGLVTSSKRYINVPVRYIRSIKVNDIWITNNYDNIKITDDTTYTALDKGSRKVWDSDGNKFEEIVIKWKTSEVPDTQKIKVYTYFGKLSASLDIFSLGVETDIILPTITETDETNVYGYVYPTVLNRTVFETNGTIEDGVYNDEDVDSANRNRFVAFEITVYKDGASHTRRSPIIKIQRQPLIRNYRIIDDKIGNKPYNYEYGFNTDLYSADSGVDLTNTKLTWGLDRVTLSEWLGVELDTKGKSFNELFNMYLNNFWKNIVRTYERFRNIISPVWFDLDLIFKTDYRLYIENNIIKFEYIGATEHIDMATGKKTYTPYREYLIDEYDKDFLDWLLSLDHQHTATIDKDDFVFYEKVLDNPSDINNLNKLKSVTRTIFAKDNIPFTENIFTNDNIKEIIKYFIYSLDCGYITFRLSQYEFMPRLKFNLYPVHWQCPMCDGKFVVAQNIYGKMNLYKSNEQSEYYKQGEMGESVNWNFNVIRRARKEVKCPYCDYKPTNYEIELVPNWLKKLTGLDLGIPKIFGKTNGKLNIDLYDYNNRLDNILNGLFYAGNNTASTSFFNLKLLTSQLFSGEYKGDIFNKIINSSEHTDSSINACNNTGINNFKDLFADGNKYINEFRNYYKATCMNCGHTLYLDILYSNGSTINCPYCLHDTIVSNVTDGDGNVSVDEIVQEFRDTETVKDYDLLSFYHRCGSLDCDIQSHYSPNGTIQVLSPNTETLEEKYIDDIENTKVTFAYNKSYGKFDGFYYSLVCVPCELEIDEQTQETNKIPYEYFIDIENDENGNEKLSVPYINTNIFKEEKPTEKLPLIGTYIIEGEEPVDYKFCTEFAYHKLTDVTYTETSDKVFVTFNLSNNIELSTEFLSSVMNDKMELCIIPVFEHIWNSSNIKMIGKRRTYRKHDIENIDTLPTDYGLTQINDTKQNIYMVKEIKTNHKVYVPPVQSTNIYNIYDTEEKDRRNKYHWYGKNPIIVSDFSIVEGNNVIINNIKIYDIDDTDITGNFDIEYTVNNGTEYELVTLPYELVVGKTFYINAKLKSTYTYDDIIGLYFKTTYNTNTEKETEPFDLYFYDINDLVTSQHSTIYSDIKVNDITELLHCPICNRYVRKKDNGNSIDFFYNEDIIYNDNIEYIKGDLIHKDTINPDIDYQELFNESWNGTHCPECGGELVIVASIDNGGDGIYWVNRAVECFNGFYNHHTPLYAMVNRNKQIDAETYKYLSETLSTAMSTANNFLSNSSTLKYTIDGTYNIKDTDTEIKNDTANSKILLDKYKDIINIE